MTYLTFTPPVRPKTSANSAQVRVLSNNYGDGYAQVVDDGINCVQENLTLTWPVLTFEQAEQICTFLKSNKSRPFFWSLPGQPAKKWRCLKWQRTFQRGTCSITADFTEVFV